jgi:hypothetical protein
MKFNSTLITDRVYSVVIQSPYLSALQVVTKTGNTISEVFTALHTMRDAGVLIMEEAVDLEPLSPHDYKRVYSVNPNAIYSYSTSISHTI